MPIISQKTKKGENHLHSNSSQRAVPIMWEFVRNTKSQDPPNLSELNLSVMSDSWQPHELWPSRLLSLLGFPGKHTRGLSFPTPEDLSDPGVELVSPALAGGFFATGATGQAPRPPTCWVRSVQPPRAPQLISIPGGLAGEESTCNVGDPSSIPGLGRTTAEGLIYPLQYSLASLMTQLVKNPPAMWETWVRSLGWENPLEKGKATHSSIMAWRIPWTG